MTDRRSTTLDDSSPDRHRWSQALGTAGPCWGWRGPGGQDRASAPGHQIFGAGLAVRLPRAGPSDPESGTAGASDRSVAAGTSDALHAIEGSPPQRPPRTLT